MERFSRGRAFRRRLPRRFGHRPIWVSPDARLRFLRPGIFGFDQALLGYVDRYVNVGHCVWDIGANVGEFTLAAAHRVGPEGKVLAVEADCVLAALLQKSLDESRNRDLRADLLCAAVADRPGVGRFKVAARGRSANALSGVPASTQTGGVRRESLVTLTTLDLLLDWSPRPDVVKIDVEGAELLVLSGATRLRRDVRPIWIVEVNDSNEEGVRNLLRQGDYAIFDPEKGPAAGELESCAFNTLAIPREQLRNWRETVGG